MKKSDLPVGSVVTIGHGMAVKYQADPDEGYNWRWVRNGETVDYDDVYKATWDFVSAPLNRAAVEDLVRNAMGSGTVWFVDNMNKVDRSKSMTEIFNDWAAEFVKLRTDLVEALQS